MSLSTITIYADDTDAYVERIITDSTGANLTFTANVAVGAGAYNVVATWQGAVGATRTLRVPLVGLAAGGHRLYLSVPGGNDIDLGVVRVLPRT